MKIFAVTGGKGGTGKSTFAILLALKQSENGKKVLLADCDVECPNDHIILGIDKLENPVKNTYTYYPKLLKNKCTNCGKCVDSCRANAIFMPSEKYPVFDDELCSSCGVCWHICPEKAISKRKEINGKIYLNKISDNLDLLTGISKVGVRETSPIVRDVRNYIDQEGQQYDFCIIDTAAGSHCTVIAALESVDYAYTVTESTPLGAHDLKIILEVLEVLEVKKGIVVNQYDVGKKNLIKEISLDYKTDIKARIPYSKKLAEIYSKGEFNKNKSLVELLELNPYE